MSIPTTFHPSPKAPSKKEILKEVSKMVKPKLGDQMLMVTFGYSTKLIFPYKDGMTFVGSLENALVFTQDYNKPETVRQFDSGEVTITPLSAQEFQDYQMAAILGVKSGEIKSARISSEELDAQERASLFRGHNSPF